MHNNIGTILVLFILLVIIACSCGVLGRNERREERNDERRVEGVNTGCNY
ncbi:hypothetical protein [Paenibacillus sp. FSL A5-0031]|nr:hypothetical protein [Paenibacillus sp. FSL A5-0031]